MVMCGEPGSAEAVDLSQDSLRDGDGNSNTSSVEVKGGKQRSRNFGSIKFRELLDRLSSKSVLKKCIRSTQPASI